PPPSSLPDPPRPATPTLSLHDALPIWPHPLRALGRADDPVHLPLRQADPRRRAPRPHPRRGDVRPPRALLAADAGRLQRARLGHLADLELHRRPRDHRDAVPAGLLPRPP